MVRRAILAVDEGTTGTRAAWVTEDGDVGGLTYEKLTVSSPRPGVVEQSAAEILQKTIEVMRAAYASALDNGFEVEAVAITTQRSTATLWNTETGEPLAPSMVWQDTRFSRELAALGERWDDRLWRSVGRPTGVRSVYLWAAETLKRTPAAAEAHAQGKVGFGTVDSWLLWNLSTNRQIVASATNATSSGAYVLAEHRYHQEYIEELGFPLELLPELRDDADDFGTLREDVLGKELPILVAMGDQHAAIVGLGVLDQGQAMCVHGTGSFVDLNVGTSLPENTGAYEGALTLVGWRADSVSRFSIETFSATTGSFVDWLVNKLQLFDSGQHIAELAARGKPTNVVSMPALTGVRMPRVHPGVGAVIAGMSTATTREDVAYAVQEGIAQSVAWSLHADEEVAGISLNQVVVGGGLSQSDPLVQMQADLTGVSHLRFRDTDKASLRGAAFLAGVRTGVWGDLRQATDTLGEPDRFEPQLPEAERSERLQLWRDRVRAELQLADEREEMQAR